MVSHQACKAFIDAIAILEALGTIFFGLTPILNFDAIPLTAGSIQRMGGEDE